MNVDLQKESIKIMEMISQKSSEVTAETDIIVPDSQPDIVKILGIDGNAVIENREIQSDKIIINGRADFIILYAPENTDEGAIKPIKTTLSFTDVCDVSGLKGDARVELEAEVEDVDIRLINSRKLNLKAVIAIDLKAYRQNETELVTDVITEVPLETKKETIKAYTMEADGNFTITVSDKVDVPTGKALISEVLKTDAAFLGHDTKIITNKVIIKGTIRLCTLYNDVEGNTEFMEHDIPFTEILDLPGAAEGMNCDIDFKIRSIYYELGDGNGGASDMGVEITLDISACVVKTDSVEILSDCYSPKSETSITKRKCKIDYVDDNAVDQFVIRGPVSIPQSHPAIFQIYNVMAKPVIKSASADNGQVEVTGFLRTKILYLSEDISSPISEYEENIPFTYNCMLSAKGMPECKITVLNISYNITGDYSVDIRANAEMSIKLIESNPVDIIEMINISDEIPGNRASIVIAFVREGDSLWNIAKKYKTTVAKIAEANGIAEDGMLKVGTKLIIP